MICSFSSSDQSGASSATGLGFCTDSYRLYKMDLIRAEGSAKDGNIDCFHALTCLFLDTKASTRVAVELNW